MRRTTAARLALLVVTTALMLAAFTDSGPNGACPGPRECGAGPLPAPVTITAGRVSDRIARDGHALRIAPGGSTHGHVVWFPGTGTWFELQHGHRRVGPKGRGYLVVGRGPRGLGRDAVWRSRAQFAADSLGLIAAGPSTVAFQHDHRLYLAASGGAMRPTPTCSHSGG